MKIVVNEIIINRFIVLIYGILGREDWILNSSVVMVSIVVMLSVVLVGIDWLLI